MVRVSGLAVSDDILNNENIQDRVNKQPSQTDRAAH